MKILYKLILFALISGSIQITYAEIEIQDVLPPSNDEISEPRLKLTLFPGIARPPNESLVLKMQNTSPNRKSILDLNSSLLIENESLIELNEIKASSNNILELHF